MAPPSNTSPIVIGRYAIYGEIAVGGMATVHYARLLGAAGFARTVAVKRLHPHIAKDQEFSHMFVDEARLAARIRHPNVVSTIDVAEYGNELLLVMEYVHGVPLSSLGRAARRNNERVPPSIAASIIIDALHGLHAAHEAKGEQGETLGLVHRDVSPQNIMVGSDGIARIVDFGIAKAAGRSAQTRGKAVKGKLSYMAPEQLHGGPISRLTDIYAASIVLWETLTGRRLFLGANEGETIQNCLMMDVSAPSSLVPSLPSAFDAIVARGLSRLAHKRYPTARAMALDLESSVDSVRPSEVGAWMERVVGKELASRAHAVAEIESSTAHTPASFPPPPPDAAIVGPPPVSRSTPPPPMQPPTLPEAATTALPLVHARPAEGDSLSLPQSSPGDPATRPGRRVAASILVALFALGLAGYAFKLASSSARRAPASAPTSSAASVASESPRPSPSEGEPVAASSGVPPAKATVPAVVVVDASAPRRSVGRPAPAKANRSCVPPYSIDGKGRKIFKVECM